MAQLSPKASRGKLIEGEFFAMSLLTINDTLDCPELLPGFTALVPEIFA